MAENATLTFGGNNEQLVLSQFKNFIVVSCKFIRSSLPKIISLCCELVKIRHINLRGQLL